MSGRLECRIAAVSFLNTIPLVDDLLRRCGTSRLDEVVS